jgi:hypothetical protein
LEYFYLKAIKIDKIQVVNNFEFALPASSEYPADIIYGI